MEENKDIDVIDGEAVETAGELGPADDGPVALRLPKSGDANGERQILYLRYLLVPFLFVTAALLGGLRLSGADSSFVFVRPSLLCLVFAVLLLVIFFRAGFIHTDGWFSERFPLTKNIANAAVIASVAAASMQIFNSLIPENGLPYWVVSFCFFWTLWNYLFADAGRTKLLKSILGMFALAFAVKYILLANLAASSNESWLRSMIDEPAKNVFTYLLDLPAYSAGTGFIQFFALLIYIFGLYLLPRSTEEGTAVIEVRER
jgi:hypothetical protein